ncbi:centromere protein R [Panthera leo]|uniref:centromere protein R n=1 Tax=Panthera leo TaxID=9689 RepID=UPI001C69A7CC|nr:centromere protein R [Panthera leo]
MTVSRWLSCRSGLYHAGTGASACRLSLVPSVGLEADSRTGLLSHRCRRPAEKPLISGPCDGKEGGAAGGFTGPRPSLGPTIVSHRCAQTDSRWNKKACSRTSDRVKRSLKLDHLLEAKMLHVHLRRVYIPLLLDGEFYRCLLGRIMESFDSSKITRKNSITTYSPTTGTCQMSPFASPASSKERDHKSEPSNGKRKKMNHLSLNERKESTTKDNDEFMVLLSQVEKSSEEILEIMQNLSSIQALEGSRELGKLIGISRMSCFFLQKEMQKTKELMTKVTKQKLFEKKSSGPPNKELYHLDSYEFLKGILN